MPQIRLLFMVLGILVWCGSFGYLVLNITNVREGICLCLLGIIAFVVLAYKVYSHKNQSAAKQKVNLMYAGISNLTPTIEIAIFDEKGKATWTTHPNAYPTQEAFLAKMFNRIPLSAEGLYFKSLIDERKRGEVFINGNGLGENEKWWLLEVIPLEVGDYFSYKGLMVTAQDLTTHFAPYHHVKQNYAALESFVDQSPLAVVYTSPHGIITGVNQTFCKWLELSREDLLGQSLHEFLGEEWQQDKPIISVRSAHVSSFKIFSLKTTKSQPLMFCRVDTLLINNSSFYKLAFAEASIPTVMMREDGHVIDYNPSFVRMVGDVNVGPDFFEMIHPAIRSEIMTKFRRASEKGSPPAPFEIRFKEDTIQTTIYISPLRQENGSAVLMLQFLDISEQKRLERQFIQSQKMQAVGQLAGGIAHDFNNLLTAMIGYCDLLLQRYLPNDPAYTDVMQIKQNANRAANLVRQLLAFSRQQTLQPKVVQITDSLADLSTLLRRLIGAGIELKMTHGRDLWTVKVDVSQLEQVIINLVVNARDAITQGGTLTIQTSNYQCLKQQRMGHDIITKGDYVMIEVIDTGCGIPLEYLERIFEPFFSTKEVGEGTGLGLSTVYGIVKQTGGFVLVESVVNEGTTFKILLPRYEGEEVALIPSIEAPLGDLTGRGTILLVEDENAVRMFSARALREKGYRVIEADSGEAALDILSQGEQFDLLVTDVVMPKMDGPTLSKKIRDLYPDTKTIFISGYTEDTFRKNLDHNAKIHFLPKPFTLKDLASKVKEVLTVNESIKT